MPESPDDNAGQRDRSPAYPNITLKSALDRLVEFEAHFKRSPARPEKVGDAWGIKGKAYVDRTAAALRYFGLLEYQGSGSARQITVSEDGRKYLRAQQEDTKREVIRAAALRPKQIAKYWSMWGPDRPADPACIDELVFKAGFSDKGARDFLKVYDATIAYAGLSDSDKSGGEEEGEEVEVEASQTHEAHRGPERRRHTEAEAAVAVRQGVERPGTRKEIITLDEGDVVVSFPDDLSADSVGDLKARLELFMKRLERRAATGQTFRDDGDEANR